jgi:hypothetical protein
MSSTLDPGKRGVMTSSELASHYDAHYFRTYKGAPYERSDLWFTVFRAIAGGIVRELHPGTVLEVGCAIGLLVETLRDEGVEAYGMDVSTYAIDQVPAELKPYCWVGSVLDAQPRRYDLVVCFEVLEHLAPEDADRAVANLCQMADDILFSSSPDDFSEDTHVNVRPPEYWAGLFAQHGFVRDVDFDPFGIAHLQATRFRRTSEPLHRIIANFERRFARLSQENVALRTRALETRALMAQQEQAIAEASRSHPDVAALELTVAEQAAHLEAQTERLMYMSDRESDLRALLHNAHEQLLQRDEAVAPLHQELDARGAVIEELDRAVKERTAWAERMVAEAEERGRIIDELRRALDDQAHHPEIAADAGTNDQAIAELQQLVDERTAWAERMVAEAEARGRILDDLSHQVEERDRDILILRQDVQNRPDVSEEAEAVAARIDTPPIRLFVRGYRRIRRLV